MGRASVWQPWVGSEWLQAANLLQESKLPQKAAAAQTEGEGTPVGRFGAEAVTIRGGLVGTDDVAVVWAGCDCSGDPVGAATFVQPATANETTSSSRPPLAPPERIIFRLA